MSQAMPKVLLNGRILPLEEARISPLDRGFLFGDAVYEVIPCYDGKIFELDAHLDRLARSLIETGIAATLDQTEWQQQLEELARLNGGGNLGIYIQVSRGADNGRDHRFPQGIDPTRFAMCMPLPPQDATRPHGGFAQTREDIRWRRNDIKATSLLANVMLRQDADTAGMAEVILVRDGNAIEGSASNLFIVSNGEVLTPPLTTDILPGITRQVILRLLKELEIPHAETHIPLERLRSADEIWLVSSLREIMPVTELDGVPVGQGENRGEAGPVWLKVKQAFDAYKRHANPGSKPGDASGHQSGDMTGGAASENHGNNLRSRS